MADKSGEQDIRGLDIDKLAKGFADEEYILKNFCRQAPTKSREIRWYKKTAGTLDSTDTTGITESQIYNVAEGALPDIIEQSWTREQSFTKKFMADSPIISDEDVKDNDIDVLQTNTKDIVRAIAQQVNIRIFSVLVEATAAAPTTPVLASVNSGNAIGTGWTDKTNGDPVFDILSGNARIQTFNYNTQGGVMILHPNDNKNMLSLLITTKGSSIPGFSSQKVVTGSVMEILGWNVVVTTNVSEGFAYMFIPGTTLAWRSFEALSAVLIEEKKIGSKIRVSESGEALLEHPRSACVITGI